MSSTEISTRDEFLPVTAEASARWARVMGSADVEFPVVSTPTAGGTTWEVEGEDPTKELRGVVVDDYESHVLYLDDYTGESRPPAGYWINKVCQYVTDEARAAGYSENSHEIRGGRVQNRQVLFLARPGNIVPLKIDLTGASCKPWTRFKQQKAANVGKLLTDLAVALSLESKKYPSGYSGSMLVPTVIADLPAEAAAGFEAQSEQLKPYTRATRVPTPSEPNSGELGGNDLAREFAANGVNIDAPPVL